MQAAEMGLEGLGGRLVGSFESLSEHSRWWCLSCLVLGIVPLQFQVLIGTIDFENAMARLATFRGGRSKRCQNLVQRPFVVPSEIISRFRIHEAC